MDSSRPKRPPPADRQLEQQTRASIPPPLRATWPGWDAAYVVPGPRPPLWAQAGNESPTSCLPAAPARFPLPSLQQSLAHPGQSPSQDAFAFHPLPPQWQHPLSQSEVPLHAGWPQGPAPALACSFVPFEGSLKASFTQCAGLPVSGSLVHTQIQAESCFLDIDYVSYGHYSEPTALPEAVVTENDDATDQPVCYGMVDFPGSCKGPLFNAATSTRGFSVAMQPDGSFKSESSGLLYCGKLGGEYIDILNAMLEATTLRLQITCAIDPPLALPPRDSRKSQLGEVVQQCTLSIIVYGPMGMCDDVGAFFQDVGLYLQDPRGSDLNVKYCNPHRLSSLDPVSCPMTFDMLKGGANLDASPFEAAKPLQDFSEFILDAYEDLAEGSSPEDIIRTPLKRHQKQALTFLMRREAGWNFDRQSADFWDLTQTTSNAIFFVNRISQSSLAEEPPEFCGGIVADPMGLGKTLTMIALTATDRSEAFQDSSTPPVLDRFPTLIIVPPPLLDTWLEQLTEHVEPGTMTWRLHYGTQRLVNVDETKQYDVVLSTYNTVASDWASQQAAEESFLLSVPWKRIILDEAHTVRNSKSRMSQAVCALKAKARWAVTGTPVQNGIRDLESLLKFIRAHPYDNSRRFESDIGQIWKAGDIEEAARRLRALTAGLVLRRPKTVVTLPTRTDLKCSVDFSATERRLYEELKNQTLARIEDAYGDGESGPASISYITVLQRINALRLVCDLGLNYSSRHSLTGADEFPHHAPGDWAAVAQLAFDHRREMYAVACVMCEALCSLSIAAVDEEGSSTRSFYAKCFSFVCSDCAGQCIRRGLSVTCKRDAAHDIAPVSLGWKSLEEALGSGPQGGNSDAGLAGCQPSSKVTALITQLRSGPTDEKSVVFSSWTMTLDLVQAGLEQAGITYERFDGKVPQRRRQGVIQRFRKDPGVKVLLLTLSCGSAGLTLTEASRAFLMEPHWNSTVEEQALARIHRLGQRREVTTVRFFVKDTFEERVHDLQQSKKKLEGLLIAPQAEAGAYDGLSSLEDLRRLI